MGFVIALMLFFAVSMLIALVALEWRMLYLLKKHAPEIYVESYNAGAISYRRRRKWYRRLRFIFRNEWIEYNDAELSNLCVLLRILYLVMIVAVVALYSSILVLVLVNRGIL